jgi:hypothetical protein
MEFVLQGMNEAEILVYILYQRPYEMTRPSCL